MLKVPLNIKSGRLVLRRFKNEDISSFLHFMTNKKVTQYLAFPERMTTAKGATDVFNQTLLFYDSENPLFALAAEEIQHGSFIGCCGVTSPENGEVEIFYGLLPPFWGLGFATEIARTLTSYLEDCGIKKVKAVILPGHEASKRVVVKLGFQDLGLISSPYFSVQVNLFVLSLEKEEHPCFCSAP